MYKILIPTDFSENAADALAYALDMVSGKEVHFHIVHIINPDMTPTDNPALINRIITGEIKSAQESMRALEAMCKASFEKSGVGHQVTTDVRTGSIASELKIEAEEEDVDMVIMGTNGKNHAALDRWLGTISTTVVQNAPCPIILVPKGTVYAPIENIVFATSLDPSDPFKLWQALRAMNTKDAELRCLHVVDKVEETRDKQTTDFMEFMLDHKWAKDVHFYLEKAEDITETIQEYIDTYNAQLVIMHKLKRSFFGSLFSKSETKRMIYKSDRPLLVLE